MSHNVAAELVARCFATRTAAHFAHLKTKSYAAHVALNEFYDAVIEHADAFAECYQGVFGVIQNYPEYPCPSGELKPIVELRDWLSQNRQAASRGETELGNLIDEIKTVCDRAIYKLVNLK